MRLLASCLLLLVVGCSKPDHAREHREAAAYIEKELAPATIEPRIAYFTKSPDKEITARTFQMLRARATCNGDVIEVAYNPYGDQLHIGLGTSRAVTLHLLNLELAGRSVWTNPEKLDRRKNVLDFETAPGAAIPVHQVMLDKITTTHAENFPSDQSVTVSATASRRSPDASGPRSSST